MSQSTETIMVIILVIHQENMPQKCHNLVVVVQMYFVSGLSNKTSHLNLTFLSLGNFDGHFSLF